MAGQIWRDVTEVYSFSLLYCLPFEKYTTVYPIPLLMGFLGSFPHLPYLECIVMNVFILFLDHVYKCLPRVYKWE